MADEDAPPAGRIAGVFTEPDAFNVTFSGGDGGGGTILTITRDGRLLIGPGMSMDDATQQAAALLVKYYEAAARRIPGDQADR
jgi:hypothetical protein